MRIRDKRRQIKKLVLPVPQRYKINPRSAVIFIAGALLIGVFLYQGVYIYLLYEFKHATQLSQEHALKANALKEKLESLRSMIGPAPADKSWQYYAAVAVVAVVLLGLVGYFR